MKFAVGFAAFLLVFTAAVASAADSLRLEVNALEEKPGLISVVVTAGDASGKPLGTLSASNFAASLGDVALPVSSVDAPGGAKNSTSVVLLVDVSGSMYGDSIVQARAALQEFVRTLDPNDEVAVLAFANGVTTLQDFTTNKTALNTAISKLTAFGDTALYDAISEGTRKAASSSASRKVVVVLSDGVSTVNNGNRDASITAATNSGVTIMPVGLGSAIDREYLNTIASVSGGSFVEASTAASLSEAYTGIAATIRNRYTVHFTVPATTDRTVPAKFTLRFSASGQTVVVERELPPLPGAVPPVFQVTLGGIKTNQLIESASVLTPAIPQNVKVTKIDYSIDGKPAATAAEAPFSFNLDPVNLSPGTHLLKAVATDERGATSTAEIAFRIPAPAKSSPLSSLLPILALLLVLAGVGFLGFRLFSKKLRARLSADNADNVVRIKPFAQRSSEEMAPPEEWPERRVAVPAPVNQVLGRIVVMDEAAIREGDLTKIREYSIGTAPLTLGAGESCDIQIDDEASIAMEEARLWVQKGRLVYHKLTTLSAMATEGLTSGWLLLADGEELLLGKYRLLYQAEVPATAEESAEEVLPQAPNKQFTGWSG